MSDVLQVEYEYTVTRVAPGRIYGGKVQGARTVDVGNTAYINTEIGNVSARVSDGGFVTVESPMLVRLMVNDKSGPVAGIQPKSYGTPTKWTPLSAT